MHAGECIRRTLKMKLFKLVLARNPVLFMKTTYSQQFSDFTADALQLSRIGDTIKTFPSSYIFS